MRLRDITAGDLADFHRLNQANVPAVSSIDAGQLDWFFRYADHFRVAVLDDAIAGFLLGLRPGRDYASVNYGWFNARYADFLYIDRLAVATDRRRQGIASALYADVERHALSLGAPLLACEVNLRPRNEASLSFHERHGFAEVGQQETEGGSKRVSLLIKPLAGTARDT